MAPPGPAELLRDRYAAALLSGDASEASRVVRDALDRGLEPALIYLEVLGPALSQVGEAWTRGDINIADEHLATSITMQQIAYVRDVSPRRADLGAAVVIAAVEGEFHAVGSRMIADLFFMEGWDIAHLGENNPPEDLIQLVQDRAPDLVMLSLSHRDRLPAASKAAAMLKALDRPPAVFVGGRGLRPELDGEQMAADLVSSDPLQALQAAREIVGIKGQPLTLEVHLKSLGRHIQERRKARGWSQLELASRAGIDRTYLSTVEQGKQNVTIAAVLRIADALDTTLAQLIDLS